MAFKFALGVRVRDIVSSFSGIEKGQVATGFYFDEQQLKLVSEATQGATGGPRAAPKRRPDVQRRTDPKR